MQKNRIKQRSTTVNNNKKNNTTYINTRKNKHPQ